MQPPDRPAETALAQRRADCDVGDRQQQINDFGFFMRYGGQAEEFGAMIRREFDVLYREGADTGKAMAICLHPSITGVAHRIGAVESTPKYIKGHDGVWLAKDGEMVDAYLETAIDQ